MSNPTGGETPDETGGQSAKAADDIRQTAKWLATSFGAVAALLLASIKLTDLSNLSGTSRAWALVGFGLGILGVTIAIVAMAWVLGPSTMTLATVVQKRALRILAKERDWLYGYHDVDVLAASYREASAQRITTFNGMTAAAESGDQAGLELATGHHNLACRQLDLANPAVNRQRTWRRALGALVLGVAVTAVGVGMFASQTGGTSATAAAAQEPTRVTMDLNAEAIGLYKDRLGANCNEKSMQGIALDTTDGVTTVLVSDPNCNPVELALTAQQAAIEGPSPCLELPPPGIGPISPECVR